MRNIFNLFSGNDTPISLISLGFNRSDKNYYERLNKIIERNRIIENLWTPSNIFSKDDMYKSFQSRPQVEFID